MSDPHIPVLLNAVLEHLLPAKCIIDGTLGAGGHTRAFLESGAESVLGLDVDLTAIAIARQNLIAFGDQVHIVQSSYNNMTKEAAGLGWHNIDGILLDLGVSSMQLDRPERGFAFMHDGPLDMRFDPSGNQPPASELVNHWSTSDLSDIFYKYGEERHGRRIANAIIKHRPYETTSQLADVIKQAMPPMKSKKQKRKVIHPATRIFQALRIAVNDELKVVEQALLPAIELLCPGGRLGVISFHSLEDRIVKRAFKDAATEIVSPPGMVLEEKEALVRLVTRKPITATEDEIKHNPRSRSAKLRVVEKL